MIYFFNCFILSTSQCQLKGILALGDFEGFISCAAHGWPGCDESALAKRLAVSSPEKIQCFFKKRGCSQNIARTRIKFGCPRGPWLNIPCMGWGMGWCLPGGHRASAGSACRGGVDRACDPCCRSSLMFLETPQMTHVLDCKDVSASGFANRIRFCRSLALQLQGYNNVNLSMAPAWRLIPENFWETIDARPLPLHFEKSGPGGDPDAGPCA